MPCDRDDQGKVWAEVRFDYLVAEKLMAFAEAAEQHSEFARELPGFVSEVRRIFALHEIQDHLARVENERAQLELAELESDGDDEGDNVLYDAPALVAERLRRFALIKQLLLTPQAGYLIEVRSPIGTRARRGAGEP